MSHPNPGGDELIKLHFAQAGAKAQLVRLDHSWQQVLSRHPDLSPALCGLLGQMSAASCMLSASLKFNGSVMLQIHGDGPVRLAVAECSAQMGVRATLKLRSDWQSSLPAELLDQSEPSLQPLVNQTGQGRFSLVLDTKQPDQRPYQGIVSLNDESIAAAIESYMGQSEQLATRLWLAADQQSACGLLLQQMPLEGGHAAAEQATRHEHWERLVMLADTLGPAEMLATAPQELAHRLFWEEQAMLLQSQLVQFECPCNRARVGRMLAGLGQTEIESILAEQGQVLVHCDFCNSPYPFDAVDCAQLFTESTQAGFDQATQQGSQVKH
ncbi:MAG: Hsp33 family molecular chaperone HslO [Pseudomonadota bacterium]